MSVAIGVLLALVGVAMIGFWALHIARGGLPKGIVTVESDAYITLHIVAELVTAVACLLGGLALSLGLGWGPAVGLIASGMLAYAGINSLGWGLRNSRPISIGLVVAVLMATASCAYLLVLLLGR
jgi:hypothetical protein